MLSGRSPSPSLYGATEGSANEAADVRLESFGLSRGLSAAAESAFPEGAIASILRDAFGGERRSRTGRPPTSIDRGRKAIFPETLREFSLRADRRTSRGPCARTRRSAS